MQKRRLRDGWWIYGESEWPDSRSDYVQVCDGCHTAIWSTRWNEETSDGFDAFLARNGWRRYFSAMTSRVLDSAPTARHARCVSAGFRTLADCWIRPVRSYTHADQEVSAQLSARELDGGEPAADRPRDKN